jgi:hypothetical protein
MLGRLGGIEKHVFLDVYGERIRGEADPMRENTSRDGKASSSNSSDSLSPRARLPASKPPA